MPRTRRVLSAALVAPPAAHLVVEASGAAGPHLGADSGWEAAALIVAHASIGLCILVGIGSVEFQCVRVERIVDRGSGCSRARSA